MLWQLNEMLKEIEQIAENKTARIEEKIDVLMQKIEEKQSKADRVKEKLQMAITQENEEATDEARFELIALEESLEEAEAAKIKLEQRFEEAKQAEQEAKEKIVDIEVEY